MTPKLELEREFSKAVRYAETYEEAKTLFMERMKNISEEWIDRRLRFNIMELKRTK